MSIAIEEMEARRSRIRVSLASLCRRAGVDYQVAWRAWVAGRVDSDAVIRLERELQQIEDEMRAALAS